MTTMLEIALKAARAGLYVFPCQPGDKRPVWTPSGRLRWGAAATTDELTIRDWWGVKCPTANIGVACKPSKLLVVDCDKPKSPVKPAGFEDCSDGADVFVALAERVSQPFPFDTLTVRTPSGGLHYLYRNTEDMPLRNSSLLRGWVDIRANGGDDGGYVVAPGSSRGDGAKYEVEYRAPIMAAPQWLLDLCAPEPARPAIPATSRPGSTIPFNGSGGNMSGIVNSVRYAQEGNRNQALMWAACKFAEEPLHIAEAEAELVPAAMEAGLPRGEILATIASAYRRVQGR